MAEIKTSQLDNGLTLAAVQMPDMHSVSIGVWVKAGARDERADETGIAHFLEHMAFKGTKRRSAFDIAREVEDVGGFMNAHTGREETAYYIGLLPEHIELGFDVLSDIVIHSSLPENEIERERGVILQEIGQANDTPDDYVFECFSTSCFGSHTLGQSILGTTESVSGFCQKDLSGYMSRHYGAEQMIVCVAGNISHLQAEKLVQRYFADLPEASTPLRIPPKWHSKHFIGERDLEQCHTVFGFSAPSALSNWRYAMMVLSNLYGGGMSSRLFQQVREERGLCYSIFSFAQMFVDTGVFGVYAGTSADKVNEMLEVSLAELKQCKDTISADEMERAKQQLRSAVLMRRDSVSSMMETTARQLAIFGQITDKNQLLHEIDKVSISDVSGLVEMLASTAKPSLAMVGTADDVMSIDDMASHMV